MRHAQRPPSDGNDKGVIADANESTEPDPSNKRKAAPPPAGGAAEGKENVAAFGEGAGGGKDAKRLRGPECGEGIGVDP